MTGPMTRDRFMFTELSETAPARSSLSTSCGTSDPNVGAYTAWPMPMASVHRKSAELRRVREWRSSDEQGEDGLLDAHDDEQLPPIEDVGERAADHREQQQRHQLGEDDQADEDGRPGDLVGEGAEDHVLHPAADVRQERPQEDAPEGGVGEGGPSGARGEGAIAFEEGVLRVLGGEVVRRRGIGRVISPMVVGGDRHAEVPFEVGHAPEAGGHTLPQRLTVRLFDARTNATRPNRIAQLHAGVPAMVAGTR